MQQKMMEKQWPRGVNNTRWGGAGDTGGGNYTTRSPGRGARTGEWGPTTGGREGVCAARPRPPAAETNGAAVARGHDARNAQRTTHERHNQPHRRGEQLTSHVTWLGAGIGKMGKPTAQRQTEGDTERETQRKTHRGDTQRETQSGTHSDTHNWAK